MFIDMSDCYRMILLISLMWCCVKVNGVVLWNVKDLMINLSILVLFGVFGVEGGNLMF